MYKSTMVNAESYLLTGQFQFDAVVKKTFFFQIWKKEFRQTDGQEIPNTFCLRVKITSIQTELGQNIAQNGMFQVQ